jgi:hypothetical protein
MASVYTMSWKTLAAVLIAGAIITPAASQGNQFTTTVVTLLSGERGIVDERAMATKDIVPHVVSLRGGRAGMHMVTVETCPKVPPDVDAHQNGPGGAQNDGPSKCAGWSMAWGRVGF